MTAPKRIQMTRRRPWRSSHPDAVIVARPSKWGNPFRVGDDATCAEHATNMFRSWLGGSSAPLAPEMPQTYYDRMRSRRLSLLDGIRDELPGRDLACWCPLDQPCHADVLIELANGAAS